MDTTTQIHSPLPWSWSAATEDNTIMSARAGAVGKLVIAEVIGENADADKQFIVRACNNAERLAVALRDLTREIHLGKLNVRKDFSLMNAHACATKTLHEWEQAQ